MELARPGMETASLSRSGTPKFTNAELLAVTRLPINLRVARASDLVLPVIQAVIQLIGAELRAESLQSWCQRLS